MRAGPAEADGSVAPAVPDFSDERVTSGHALRWARSAALRAEEHLVEVSRSAVAGRTPAEERAVILLDLIRVALGERSQSLEEARRVLADPIAQGAGR